MYVATPAKLSMLVIRDRGVGRVGQPDVVVVVEPPGWTVCMAGVDADDRRAGDGSCPGALVVPGVSQRVERRGGAGASRGSSGPPGRCSSVVCQEKVKVVLPEANERFQTRLSPLAEVLTCVGGMLYEPGTMFAAVPAGRLTVMVTGSLTSGLIW